MRKPQNKPLLSASVEVEIPFQDTDPMAVVWHGNYFRYFEAARAALLRQIDYDYPQMHESGYAWPIIETHVRFINAARYQQRIRVDAYLHEWENRLRIDYCIFDTETNKRLIKGYTIQCAVSWPDGELQLVSPPALLDRLQSYLCAS